MKSEKGIAEIEHGATVLATGAVEYKPTEYLYGQDERVLTQLELEGRIAAQDESVLAARNVVMIQCVGCRNEDRNYCARICCGQAVKNALKLKEKKSRGGYLYPFPRHAHLRLPGRLLPGSLQQGRQVHPLGSGKQARGRSRHGRRRPRSSASASPTPILEMELGIDADLLVLSAAVIPSPDAKDVAAMFKVTLSPDGFFKEAHAKLKPVEFATDGVYLCGMAQYPKHIPETINQAYGAAGRVLTLLSKDTVIASGAICEVKKTDCVSCGACITACSYGAIEFIRNGSGPEGLGQSHSLQRGRPLQHQVSDRGHRSEAFYRRRDIEPDRRGLAGQRGDSA